MMMGLEGHRLTRPERAALKRIQPAGVIYFRRNVKSPAQLRALSKSVRDILGPGTLIGIDQEGGRVARLGPPFTMFPGNDFLGRIYKRTGKVDLAVAQGKAMASELTSIGVNFNFTPVADIHSNPKNPVIGIRSFGDDPKAVSALVSATVRAYKQTKVLCSAKHFPGHGDTHVDSHHVLPVVRAKRSPLLRREFVPFQAAIKSGVPAVMTAHVIYPALDKKNPATLSPEILQNILRKQLGFTGVIVSDDMEMNAIARHQSIPDAAIDALKAGVDLLLVCESLTLANEVYDRIRQAVEGRELQPSGSLRRVAKLKKGLPRLRSLGRFPRQKHEELAKKIERLGRANFLGE